jgi:hypothetical protein
MKARLYLEDDVRDQAFIRTGRQYGYRVVLQIPTTRISVKARKELLLMRSDRSRTDAIIDLGIRPPARVLDAASDTPLEQEELPPPSWTAPLVPTNPKEWNRVILEFAEYRRNELQPRLHALLARQQARLERLQALPADTPLPPNDSLDTLFQVEPYYAGLDGCEETEKIVSQIRYILHQRSEAAFERRNMQQAMLSNKGED